MQKLTITPIELEFLLWCYYSPEPAKNVHLRIIQGFIERMIFLKVLKKTKDIYELTAKGKSWVMAILSTPIPTKGKK